MTSPDKNQLQQVQEFTGNLPLGMNALAGAMEDSIGAGQHQSQPEVFADDFGQATEKWVYAKGCTVLTELDDPRVKVTKVQAVMTNVRGGTTVVTFGRTPEALDPRKGGRHVGEEAGEPGDYLMVVDELDQKGSDGNPVQLHRYLDRANLETVQLVNGAGGVRTVDSPLRKLVQVQGTVERTGARVGRPSQH